MYDLWSMGAKTLWNAYQYPSAEQCYLHEINVLFFTPHSLRSIFVCKVDWLISNHIYFQIEVFGCSCDSLCVCVLDYYLFIYYFICYIQFCRFSANWLYHGTYFFTQFFFLSIYIIHTLIGNQGIFIFFSLFCFI